jgi:GxxExxY protein
LQDLQTRITLSLRTRPNTRGILHASKRGMDHDQIVSNKVIGCAIEVHRVLGAGLLESAYQTALCVELAQSGVRFTRQQKHLLEYRGVIVGEYFPDLVVEDTVVVEIKSVLRMESVFTAQLLTYLRITGLHVGLILNFNNNVLKDGIKRVVR